jgi:hypothetical protein
MKAFTRFALLSVLPVLLLSACQSPKDRALCPGASILAPTSALTRFKPGMEGDPSGELFRIQIVDVKSGCSVDRDEGTTDNDIEVTFRATRAPSGDPATFTAPYFVASTFDGLNITSKKILATAFTFQPGESTVTVTAEMPSLVIKFENGKKAYQYGIVVGLQLTREDMTYNAHAGRFAP